MTPRRIAIGGIKPANGRIEAPTDEALEAA
jgi:hypothetical protein